MEAKGTAVITIPDYIKRHHGDMYKTWLEKLTPSGQKIMSNPIMATAWYPLTESLIQPTQVLAEMTNCTPEAAAYSLGRYSSEVSLNGVYKIFLRVSNPLFVLSRASTVLGSYYRPATIEIVSKSEFSTKMKIVGFGGDSHIIINRIAGWVERTIEITGFKNISVQVEKPEGETLPCGYVIPSWGN